MDERVKLLTKRERELLHHVYLGRRTTEIARLEGIAAQTVLNRLQEARHKLGGLDRRRAAVLVAEFEGWLPGIKPPAVESTLSNTPAAAPNTVADTGVRQVDRERAVFVETPTNDGPPPFPQPGRRNNHDLMTRISMLLVRIAFLVAATFAFLWVYGRV